MQLNNIFNRIKQINPNIKFIGQFDDNNQRIGYWEQYYSNGNRHGYFVWYRTNGTILLNEQFYFNKIVDS